MDQVYINSSHMANAPCDSYGTIVIPALFIFLEWDYHLYMELQEGETIIAIVRQHWFVVVQPIAVVSLIVAMLATAGLYFQFDFFGYSYAVYLIMGFAILLFLLYKFYLWRKNNLVITNSRISDDKIILSPQIEFI